jgi:hypothetical protein
MPHAGRLAMAAVVTVAALTVGTSPDHKTPGVEIACGRCSVGSGAPNGGDQTVIVHNADSVTMEVQRRGVRHRLRR